MTLLLSRRDLEFLLYDWLDAESLHSEHSRETFDAVLDLAAEVAAEHFAPHNKRADAEEPTFDGGRVHMIPEVRKALDVLAQTGLVASSTELPHVVSTAAFAYFQAANPGTWAYPFLTIAAANLLRAHGTPEQVETYVEPMVEGRFHGTMCLSEPQAGSSLADITTRAEPQADGTYRLFGNKMWISAGEHELGENIVHLVLAKIPGGPPGVKGISLFLVPKLLPDGRRNDIALAGLNHKMGYRGTTNTLLNFGEGAGAVGQLVGPEHGGLACMFHMMNEARVGVGAGAAALGYTGYLKSLDYARTRTQGRATSAKDPAAPPVPIIEHPDVRRMLLAQKCYAEGALALVLYCGRLLDDQNTGPDPDRARLLLDVLTPIAKSWPSQWCVAANDLAIQVHGGYGYTREYDVEQHYRDNRLNPIHEGTHGIQALDLLGRKVVIQGGAGLALLREIVAATCARATTGEAAELAAQLDAVWDRIVAVTARIHADPHPERLADATTYLEAVGHAAVAWIWLEQYLACGDRDEPFHRGKRQAARYFFRRELPRTGPQLDLLAALDRTTVEMEPDWF
ncbi:acyl-CoA dehydrogenase [Pseudonocardia cypriaca]|uniref:Butyryl-CoA dehydrogenase n=1 Tax=Pseudonocardia cypriaca TaxID=882449 RepID=A0A543GIZ6_9PSEU|nr:acyl-CoA dehydrogenase family protein [Pseudonocardia cypriaca]TQM46053.1 butyryl-CoA dehydrogenase [Pseudonocardia cypriaca]